MKVFNINRDLLRPVPEEHPKWFGYKEEKAQIQSAIVRSLKQQRPYGIILQGAWGSGKTHAAKYFSAKPFAEFKEDGVVYGGITSIYLEGPKIGSPSFLDFYHRVFNAVSFRRLKQAMAAIIDSGQKESFEEELYNRCKDEDVVSLLVGVVSSEVDARAVFLGKSTSKQRSNLGVLRDFKKEFEMSLLLRGIFLLLSWPAKVGEKATRIVLWLDELENLIYMREAQIQQFSQHFRHFWDHADNVTVVLCFSFSDPTESGTIDGVLSGALVERVSDRIIFDYPDSEKTRAYLVDLVKGMDSRNSKGTNHNYPFTNGAFDKVVSIAVGQTPRSVNEGVLRVVQAAESTRTRAGKISLITSEEVEPSFVPGLSESG